jgi:hypothetical protein
MPAAETRAEVHIGAERSEQRLGVAGVDDADALVSGSQTLPQIGDEDLIPLRDTSIESTNMIARGQLKSRKSERNRSHHVIPLSVYRRA